MECREHIEGGISQPTCKLAANRVVQILSGPITYTKSISYKTTLSDHIKTLLKTIYMRMNSIYALTHINRGRRDLLQLVLDHDDVQRPGWRIMVTAAVVGFDQRKLMIAFTDLSSCDILELIN